MTNIGGARTIRVAVFPGDGIGPEVTGQARQVLDCCAARFGFRVTYREGVIGGAAIDGQGTALPDESLEMARASDAVLLGAVGGPQWDDPQSAVRPEQALLGLRKGFELFANLRPIRVQPALVDASPLKPALLESVDILVVRELTGGIYFGRPSGRQGNGRDREAVDTCSYTAREIERVCRLAFRLAEGRRRKVTSVDKANILASSRLWREVAHEVAADFPRVACEDVLVDAMAMHLLRRPRDFDVVVTENMFGDILTDEASMLMGSLGLLPSASLGQSHNALGHPFGLYEPIHGSAPDIAGRDLANPLGTILSVGMMLEHSFGERAAAAALENAVERVLVSGLRTADIRQEGCRVVGCREMGEAVCRQLESDAQ